MLVSLSSFTFFFQPPKFFAHLPNRLLIFFSICNSSLYNRESIPFSLHELQLFFQLLVWHASLTFSFPNHPLPSEDHVGCIPQVLICGVSIFIMTCALLQNLFRIMLIMFLNKYVYFCFYMLLFISNFMLLCQWLFWWLLTFFMVNFKKGSGCTWKHVFSLITQF